MSAPQAYKIHKSKDGLYYWTVQAENGEVLATSETYERAQGAVNGIKAAGGDTDKIDWVVIADD